MKNEWPKQNDWCTKENGWTTHCSVCVLHLHWLQLHALVTTLHTYKSIYRPCTAYSNQIGLHKYTSSTSNYAKVQKILAVWHLVGQKLFRKAAAFLSPLKTRPHWIQIQTGSVTELLNANSMRINPMRINRVHTALCRTMHVDFKWPHLHTATVAPSSDLYFSQPSYCFSSWADM